MYVLFLSAARMCGLYCYSNMPLICIPNTGRHIRIWYSRSTISYTICIIRNISNLRWHMPDVRGISEPLLIYFKLWSHVMSEICSFLVKKKMKRLLVIALIIFVHVLLVATESILFLKKSSLYSFFFSLFWNHERHDQL